MAGVEGFHRADDRTLVFAKGAPERIISMCGDVSDLEALRAMEQAAVQMAEQGFRVLAIALIIFPTKELHKLSWWWRHRQQEAAAGPR